LASFERSDGRGVEDPFALIHRELSELRCRARVSTDGRSACLTLEATAQNRYRAHKRRPRFRSCDYAIAQPRSDPIANHSQPVDPSLDRWQRSSENKPSTIRV